MTTDHFAMWEAQLAPSPFGRLSAILRNFLFESMIGLGRCYCVHTTTGSPDAGTELQSGAGTRADGVDIDAGSELDEP